MRNAIFVCVVMACAPAPGGNIGRTQSALTGSVSVTDFGAVPDDGVDDRAAIQSALNSGAAEVTVPVGVFDASHGAGFYDLIVPTGVTLRGLDRDGSVLRQSCGQSGSVRLLQVAASNVTISTLTLDGQAECQPLNGSGKPDEHRAGTFIQAPTGTSIWGVRVEHVTARDFSGDGLYAFVAGDSTNPTDPTHVGVSFDDVEVHHNLRNGLTLGGILYSAAVTSSYAHDNAVQQFDSETGTTGFINNIRIADSVIDGSSSNDYALTVSGGSESSHSHNWTVTGNTITGGINVVWADDVLIQGNTVVNPTTKAGVTVWRGNGVVTLRGNVITNTNATTVNDSVVYASGTGVGAAPANVVVDGNTLSAVAPKSFGVRAEGCKRVSITSNVVTGPPGVAAFYPGVTLRASIGGEDFVSATIHDNTIRNWGLGVSVGGIVGNVSARILALEVSSNVFDDTAGTELAALSPDADGSHAVKDLRVGFNTLSGGCTALYTGRAMTGTWSAEGDHWVVP